MVHHDATQQIIEQKTKGCAVCLGQGQRKEENSHAIARRTRVRVHVSSQLANSRRPRRMCVGCGC